MKIFVLGGSGMVGSRVVAEAQSRGHEVTAASRRGPVTVDANDAAALAKALQGQDVLIVALGPDRTGSGAPQLTDTYTQILKAAEQTGVRVLFIGGAGSSEVAPGQLLIDSPHFPAEYREEARQALVALGDLRASGTPVKWTVASPAAVIAPGERSGKYRTGTDNLVSDAQGNSQISAEDFAVALVDEAERAQHVGKRFTVGD